MTPVDASTRRSDFCARLKREREHRGVSLAAIADKTKVKTSLLDALERGDLSRWPKGIYRRSFFRDYLSAAGLSVDEYNPDFLALFCDDVRPAADKPHAAARIAPAPPPVVAQEPLIAAPVQAQALTFEPELINRMPVALAPITRAPVAPPVTAAPVVEAPVAADVTIAAGPVSDASAPAGPFRLTFVETKSARASVTAGPSALSPARALLALADVALVLLVSSAAMWLLGKSIWQAASVTALVTLVVTTITGHSPAVWMFLQATAASNRAAVPATTGGAPSTQPWRALGARVVILPSLIREYFDRLSYSASMTARSQRSRDLVGVRRRRVEAANASGVDEAGII